VGAECQVLPDRRPRRRDTPSRETNTEPSKTPSGLPAEGHLSIPERSRAR